MAQDKDRIDPMFAHTQTYDAEDALTQNMFWNLATMFGRQTSMDIQNDPRFFAGNVMDKRLGAFKGLTLVSSIMFGTAVKQVFALKKDMDFSKHNDLAGNIAIWQTVGFFLSLAVAIQCLLSLYIIAQQLFYTYRLMTAGPLGFDLAAVFYLTRTITMWRHAAIKLLFNGMLKFLVLVGIQLFVSFINDAAAVKAKHDVEMVVNMANFSSQKVASLSVPKPVHLLDMRVHIALGYVVLAICAGVGYLMCRIAYVHKAVFGENYRHCEESVNPIQRSLDDMGHRARYYTET